ncbi:hypothetical protein Hanom_Chr03g00186661 [Helianthus anomalus]
MSVFEPRELFTMNGMLTKRIQTRLMTNRAYLINWEFPFYFQNFKKTKFRIMIITCLVLSSHIN